MSSGGLFQRSANEPAYKQYFHFSSSSTSFVIPPPGATSYQEITVPAPVVSGVPPPNYSPFDTEEDAINDHIEKIISRMDEKMEEEVQKR